MKPSNTGARARRGAIVGIAATLLAGLALGAQAADRPHVVRGAISTNPVAPTHVKRSVLDVPAARAWQPGDPIKEIPKRGGNAKPSKVDKYAQEQARALTAGRDPLLEVQERALRDYNRSPSRAFSTPLLNFAGQGYSGVNPPDTVGDVGNDYYIQSINGGGGALVAIYNKADGTLAAPVFAMESLATSGSCTSGLGDPIILHDQLANRWLLSEFSSSGNFMCVYISDGPDPTTSGWYAYAFQAPSFPDYPKYGVWPDAYYVSSNETSSAAYAFDRVRMLAGLPATMQRFTASDLAAFGFQALQAADIDGPTAPPAGSPGIFMRHNDDEAHSTGSAIAGQDTLEIFEFDVDWNTPGNSTFSGPISVPIAEIDSELCGFFAFACFPQPNSGTTLDPLREVVMFRLTYRNVGSHQTLVGNLVTDVNGADQGGKRWFELRDTGSGWTLFQEGTYAPDTDSRFMGSIAMDGAGNIALGYSVTSTSTNPGMRYVGRLASDPAGTMPQGEYTLVNGGGPNGSNRYGDYSAMNVDPVDDCTFWHTNMYAVGNGQWATQIAAFRFDACGTPGFTIAPQDTNPQICAPGSVAPITVNIGSVSEFTNPVSLVLSTPAGISGSLTPTTVIPGNSSALNLTVGGAVAAGQYPIVIDGTASGADAKQATIDLDVTTEVPATASLQLPPNGATVASTSPTFVWDAIPGATGYGIQISTDAAFTNILVDEGMLQTPSYTVSGLSTETTYYWRARASNICGTNNFSAAFQFTTGAVICATGPVNIVDESSTSLDAASSSSAIIDDLDVSINATHTWVGDLTFTLEHVDSGTTVTVVDRPGVPASTFGCDADNVDAVFDDASATPVETFCGSPGLNGTLMPQQPLSAFNGESLGGTWRMTVSDGAGGDTGTFDEWCLLPTTSGGGTDSDGDGVTDDADNCTDVPNADQRDTNGDGIGNICDPDVTGPDGTPEDCLVNFADLQALKDSLFATPADAEWDEDLDFNNDSSINFGDLQIMKNNPFFGAPGPSATGCN